MSLSLSLGWGALAPGLAEGQELPPTSPDRQLEPSVESPQASESPPEPSEEPAEPSEEPPEPASKLGVEAPPASAESPEPEEPSAESADRPIEVRARVMSGFEHEARRPRGAQTRLARKRYGFFVKQARLGVKAWLADDFRLNVSFDLKDALSPTPVYDSPPYLRTAAIDYRPSKRLRFRVGRFKRALSRLELTSSGELPVIGRGLFNGLALEDNQWGDRAMGAMASGRVSGLKLRWWLSLTNPGWDGDQSPEGLDVIARVELRSIPSVRLAVDGGYKTVEIADEQVEVWAFGGDVRVKLGATVVTLEAHLAELPFATERPEALGVTLLADHSFDLSTSWVFRPAAFLEYVDADRSVSQTESVRVAVGLNLIAHETFRVMPQFAMVRSVGDTSARNPWLESEEATLLFSLQR